MKKCLERAGGDVAHGLSRARIPPNVLDDSETALPYGVVARFVEEMARLEKVDTLGTQLGQAAPIEALGMFGRSVANAGTLANAIASAQHIAAFYSDEVFWLTRAGDQIWLRHRFPTRVDASNQAEQFSLALVLRLLRSIAAPPWHPTVQLKKGMPRAMAGTPLLRDAAISFNHRAWAIGFPASLLGRTLPPTSTAPPSNAELARWKASAPAPTYAGGVEHVVRLLARTGTASMAHVAAWLRTSTRTLQRRLEAAGVTYAQLLARVQLDAAVRLLDDHRLTVGAVALELGYSDPAHFSRAFRRWTGSTPKMFRRLRANGMVAFPLEYAGDPGAIWQDSYCVDRPIE